MKKKFEKNEDIAIINAFMSEGFKLTKKACTMLLEEDCKKRTEKSIKNRFYRTLANQYKNFLNKDFHIRIFLKLSLTNAILSDNATNEAGILRAVANRFSISPKTMAKVYFNGDKIWSKKNISQKIDGVPDTALDMVNMYLEEEDSVLHLFDETIEAIRNKEREEKDEVKEEKLSIWQRIKNWFRRKCTNS